MGHTPFESQLDYSQQGKNRKRHMEYLEIISMSEFRKCETKSRKVKFCKHVKSDEQWVLHKQGIRNYIYWYREKWKMNSDDIR